MPSNLGRDKVWDDATWQRIDQAVLGEVGRIRVAQKIFPAVSVGLLKRREPASEPASAPAS